MKNLLRIARYFALSLVATVALSGCGQDGEDDDQVNLRFINAVSDVYGVDFLVDGDVWFEDLGYVQDTGYFTFDTDQHLFQVVPSDSLTPISNLLTMLSDDKDYTYIAIGSALDATALMLVDNNEKAGEGSFKLRIIDAWQSTPSLNVYIVANGSRSVTRCSTERADCAIRAPGLRETHLSVGRIPLTSSRRSCSP